MVLISEDEYQNIKRQIEIAEWLKEKHPIMYAVAEFDIRDRKEAKERGVSEAHPGRITSDG